MLPLYLFSSRHREESKGLNTQSFTRDWGNIILKIVLWKEISCLGKSRDKVDTIDFYF